VIGNWLAGVAHRAVVLEGPIGLAEQIPRVPSFAARATRVLKANA
jgi:hypothetical protein